MDEIITTCVQQQIRVFETHDEFRNDIQRFMRLAKIKDSHLVVFPELSGLLLAAPFAPGLKRTLLRVAERQVGKKPSFLDRMVGRAADSAADVLGGIAKSLTDAIIEHENANGIEVEGATFNMVHDTTRGANDDMHAAAE